MPSVYSRDKSVAATYFELAAENYPGIYLTWDQLTSDDFGLSVSPVLGVNTIQRMYVISKSPQINGNYIEVNRQPVPENEYLDEFGKPGYYYKISLVQVNLASAEETTIATSTPISGDEQLIKTSLAYEIKQFLDIPVYDEELTFNYDRTRSKLTYSPFLYQPRPELRISSASNDGYSESYKIIDFVNGLNYSDLIKVDVATDYVVATPSGNQIIEKLYYDLKSDGTIYFKGLYNGVKYPVAIPLYDTIFASYRVKMFSNTEMNDALYQALQQINAFPGSPKFRTLEATPFYYEQSLIVIATYILLRRLLGRLTQREIRLLIGDLSGEPGGNGYTAGLDGVKALFDEYKGQIEDARKNAAYAYWPRINTVTTETYQLPGSRSYLFRSMFKGGAYG